MLNYKSTLCPETLSPAKTLKTSLFLYLCLNPILITVTFIWLFCLFLLCELGFSISFQEQDFFQFLQSHPPHYQTAIAICSGVILAPIIEELFFRGGMDRYLIGKTSSVRAALITATVFALIHRNLAASVPLFFFSLFLSACYRRERTLQVPILVHALFNGSNILCALMRYGL
jgi:membrane protease YdiL (CAAX protease family)